MKKMWNRVSAILLALTLTLSLTAAAFAESEGLYDPDKGEGILTETTTVSSDGYTSPSYTVTFVAGNGYELTARTGTNKNTRGDVQVDSVNGVISQTKIPGVETEGQMTGWAVMDGNGNLTSVDLSTYRFTANTKVYAVVVKSDPMETHSFDDVPDGYWAKEAIDWAYNMGYISGTSDTTFNPTGKLTRQQVWMILARLSGETPANMAEAREWAMTERTLADGTTQSVSDGTNPKNAVSRQQLVTILCRYARIMGFSTEAAADLSIYPDVDSVASYAKDAMSWSVANNIVSGTTQGTLDPTGTATRAQFAVILQRFYNNLL